jgi:methylated-DNA-protein-cysteine methyltransferase related protein
VPRSRAVAPEGASFDERVIAVLGALRPGEVLSYGEVAQEAGHPGAARAVGNLLRRGPAGVPWWRVVRADGAIACRRSADQAARLVAEGVEVREGRVVRRRPGP